LKTKLGDAMKALMLSKLAMVAVAALVLTVRAMAQEAHTRRIVVSLEDRKLALVVDGQVKKVYSVAVGNPSTPSPVGSFTIALRASNPTYHHNGKTVLPGPGNPVGTRWMGLSIPGLGPPHRSG
jgi:lipoprotein-anchoring transpeptidase ErfK/SrfK